MKNMKISSSSPPHFVFLEGYPHLFTCSIVGYYVPISHWFVEVASYTMIFNIVHSIKHMCWKSTPPWFIKCFQYMKSLKTHNGVLSKNNLQSDQRGHKCYEFFCRRKQEEDVVPNHPLDEHRASQEIHQVVNQC